MFMQIRKGMSEEDGLQYHALMNMAETDVTRMSTDYADNELELFRKTMDLIVDSDNGTASSTDILNCADSLQTKKLKKRETEHVLNRLVQDKWLNEKNGDYSLSTRCIMEMEQYIRMLYQDQVKVCHICHNVALQIPKLTFLNPLLKDTSKEGLIHDALHVRTSGHMRSQMCIDLRPFRARLSQQPKRTRPPPPLLGLQLRPGGPGDYNLTDACIAVRTFSTMFCPHSNVQFIVQIN
ncbi:non-structural maintenance of chromosomes element 1 homolog isoform X4 [Salvelinus fontinalis]|nr:non-structural maintenance of chromosomes element 1 homolog isoform X4 [Salvelinus fontinalis]XP_055753329.1 non-structural maintenance of chromosomes element 1 homolog isoform X4 [Salvelinus fontinalis]XP_055753330.1 non-structural maintenance of chromosomes element 1 homolog isoform X4 [Salvelinus fontinalis]